MARPMYEMSAAFTGFDSDPSMVPVMRAFVVKGIMPGVARKGAVSTISTPDGKQAVRVDVLAFVRTGNGQATLRLRVSAPVEAIGEEGDWQRVARDFPGYASFLEKLATHLLGTRASFKYQSYIPTSPVSQLREDCIAIFSFEYDEQAMKAKFSA